MALPALGTMLLLSGLASGLDYLGARKRQREFRSLQRAEDMRQKRIQEQADAAYQASLPRYEQEEFAQQQEEMEEEIGQALKGNQMPMALQPGLAPKAQGEAGTFEVAERGRERAYTDAQAEAQARLGAMGDVFFDYGLQDEDINRILREQGINAGRSMDVFRSIEGPTAANRRNLFDLGSMITRAGSAAYGMGMFPGAPAAAASPTVIPNAPPLWGTWGRGI